MAINITTLFTRVGQLGGALNSINAFQDTTISQDVLDAIAQADGASAGIRNALQPRLLAAIDQGRNALAQTTATLKEAAQALLIQTVYEDNPLQLLDVPTALAELKRQMQVQSHYITPNTLGISATQTNLDGAAVVAASVKDEEERDLQNLLDQTYELRVTGVGAAGRETIEMRGEDGPSDPLNWEWQDVGSPGGFGSLRTLTAVDAATAGENWLTNGGFETWSGTPAALTGWTLATGTAGTHIVEETSTVYKGSKGVKLVGDGSNLTTLEQDITARVPRDRATPIAWNLWMRRDGTAAAAGTLRIELTDGSNTVLTDESGNAIQQDIDLTALTTSFVAKTHKQATPRKLPATIKLRLRLTTALTNARAVYLDHLALAERIGGSARPGWEPFVAIFSGNPDLSLNDHTHVTATGQSRVFQLVPTNNRASGWASLTDKFWDTSLHGIILPYAGTNLISDALIA